MNTFKFESDAHYIGMMPNFAEEVIKDETMFFNTSPEFARTQPNTLITKAFLDTVDKYLTKTFGTIPAYVLDSRVHMLMKGWYACIPGWHHDDQPRSIPNGQPNYHNPEYNAKHIMALVNGNICPTEFARGECELPDIEDDEMYYKKWHPLIDQMCNDGKLERFKAIGDPVIYFDNHSFHQGAMANARGFRWFARVSWDTDRTKKITNEIRRNANVYLPAPMEGW